MKPRQHRHRKIGELLKRLELGEDEELRLRDKDGGSGKPTFDDPGVLTYAYELVDDWKHRRPLSQDGRDFLMYVLLDHELGPASSGRLANKPAKAQKTQDLAKARAEYRQLITKDGETAEDAAGIVAHRYPKLFPVSVKNPQIDREKVKDTLQHFKSRLRD